MAFQLAAAPAMAGAKSAAAPAETTAALEAASAKPSRKSKQVKALLQPGSVLL